nr:MAG: polyprotein [Picornavirales sp.]
MTQPRHQRTILSGDYLTMPRISMPTLYSVLSQENHYDSFLRCLAKHRELQTETVHFRRILFPIDGKSIEEHLEHMLYLSPRKKIRSFFCVNSVHPCRIKGYVAPVCNWSLLYVCAQPDLESLSDVTVDSETDGTLSLCDSDSQDSLPNSLDLQSLDFETPIQLSEETDYIIKLIENILTFVRLVSKAKDNEDYALAVAVFAQCRSNTSLTTVLLNQWGRIMSYTLQDSDGLPMFEQLKDILSRYESIKKLPIFTKLYKFLMYCIGTSIFEKMGVEFDISRFTKLEEAAIKREFHLGPDFVHCMLDTVVFMCETGYQCMTTGSIDPIFHHESTYEKWIQQGEKLRIQSRYITNPEPHGFTVFDFLNRLDDCLEKGRSIIKFMHKQESCAMIIRRLVSDLENIRADCKTRRLAQQERKAPFAVLVHGGSSVAKSQFTKLLYYHYGKMFNLPITDEYKYTRNAFDQYWTNFNSSQWCLQLDDIAYLHPNSAQGCDPSLMEMLQVVNNVPYVPTQADIIDKGKTPVRARFVIATSNTETLNANTYFACPLAVQRRLPFVISIEPKPKYRRDGGPMIDPTKIPPSVEGEYPDLWYITVKKVVPTPADKPNMHMGQTAELQEIDRYESVFEFLKWFSHVARCADGHQEQALKCDLDMRKVVICHHDLPRDKCDICCMALQSGEMVPVGEVRDETVYNTSWTQSFWERFEEANARHAEYDRDTEEQTMASMLKTFTLMPFVTRLIVAYYLFILWLMKSSQVAAFILGIFYGPFAFFNISCFMLHIPEVREVTVQIIGYRAYRATRSPKVVLFCSAILAAVTIVKASRCLINTHAWFSAPPPPEDCGACDTELTEEQIRAQTPSWFSCKSKKCKYCATCLHNAELALQGAAAERGSTPEAAGDKKENVWYKDNFECTNFDVTPSTLSKTHWTLDDLIKFVTPNCISYVVRARTEDSIVEKYGRATCIGGHTYLFNNHCVPFDAFELTVIFQTGKDGVNQNHTMLVTPGQLLRYPNKDLLFVQLPNIPPKRDIRDLFSKASFEGRFDGTYVARSKEGQMYTNNFIAPKRLRDYEYIEKARNVHFVTDAWSYKVNRATELGDCGSLAVSQTTMGPIILGIHVLGGVGDAAISIAVDSELLMSLPVSIFSDAPPRLQVGEYKQNLVELNKKATVRYIEQGTLQVHGSLSGFRGRMKSRVKKTLMSDIAVRDGFKRETGPPVMNSYVPWRKALVPISQPISHIDVTLLNHCVDGFVQDILNGLTKEDLSELKVYDMNTAINGKPGLAYVDKMPRNTSAGFPFRKSKKFFLEAVDPFDDYQHPVKVTKEIEEEMDYIIVQYENSRVYCPVFTASLKDEPVTAQKIKDGKTRVFCGAPLPWSLVVRMYLLSFIRLVQKNRFLFEAGPGTIAQSVEWHKIYEHITQFGLDRICAGDYKLFDKIMAACVLLAAFDVISRVLQAAGWTAKDLRVVSGIAEDTAFPTLDFHGELLRCYGSNPSGHPLTVIINGFANSLYCRYCYASTHPEKTCFDFKKNVALMTYGDDMIMGVSTECTWFNHTTMQTTLMEIGITFTMADKESESVPFIHIKDATFLRRSWRMEEELGYMVCPIEEASIHKMLTMCVESKTISEQLHALAVLDTACREYFWYGRKTFQHKRALFQGWLVELGLEHYAERPLPTWDQLLMEFLENSKLREVTPPGGDQPETSDHTTTDESSLNCGLTSPLPVSPVFNNQEIASRGTCQSRAVQLDVQQCVAHSEPQNVELEDSLSLSEDTSTPPSVSIEEELSVSSEPFEEYYLQADEAEFVMDSSSPPESTQATVVEFLDETPGTNWSIEHPTCTNLIDQQPQIDLAKYLSRPVLIKTHVWSQTDSFNTTTPWYPWHLFFNSTPIKNKINNYAFINCSIKLKFVINASPFYSGAMAFTYCPLQDIVGENIIADNGFELISYSQRPKVWIFPQTCEGGEMELPFFYHKNWLDLTSAADVKSMGTITPALFAALVSATGITGTSVVINVYAWAENVKLHAPTTKLALQSDEFDYKPSQISSSVAKAAGSLSRIPLIGPYMKATGVVASSISKVASAMGFTNVPNMDTVNAVKLQPYPQNSTCEVSVPMDRSAVDPKNEVSIDPRTVGLDGTDELAISNIACREAWLGNAILSSTDSVDTLTLVSRVTPALLYQFSGNLPIQFTPMGYLTTMFQAWRGDVIFRFKFVCTRFHKGRVRITFDPVNDISTSIPDYTTVFNEVVDIGAEQDIEVRIPYSQAVTFLRTNPAPGNFNLTGGALSPDIYSNGLITMRVVNPLSGPVANTAISVMVFVRAADNLEFAHPTSRTATTATLSPYILQSQEIEYPLEPKQVIAGNAPTSGDPNRYHVHYGEAVTSLRPLIHRMEYQYTVQTLDNPTTNTWCIYNLAQSRRLKYGGFDASGPWTANKVIGAGTAPYNYFKNNLPQLISLLFIGQRGSMTHSYNIESLGYTPQNISLKRYDANIFSTSYSTVVTSTSTNVNVLAGLASVNTLELNNGTALTDARNQPAIAMNFPYYSRYNFQYVKPTTANIGSVVDDTDIDNVVLQVSLQKVATTGACRVNVWSQCGPDYNFFFFRNTPSLYSYVVPTGA